MRYLGVDFGLKKIGLSLSEGMFATPLKVIHVKNTQEARSKIEDIAIREEAEKIIIGVPESGIRKTILKIVNELKEKFDVDTVEETLSSKQALEEMVKLGAGRKKRQEEDAYSAAIILQSYLDAQ